MDHVISPGYFTILMLLWLLNIGKSPLMCEYVCDAGNWTENYVITALPWSYTKYNCFITEL